MDWFIHNFRRPVLWRGHVITGLVVYPDGATILDEHGREVRWTYQRHM